MCTDVQRQKTLTSIFFFFSLFLSLFCLEIEAKTPSDALVIGFETKPQGTDPRIMSLDSNSVYVEELRFLPLISFDETGAIRHVVAKSITATGKNSWKVEIRSGIKFANGKILDADDVIATYQAIMNPKADFPPSTRRGIFENLQSLKKLSATSFEIVLKAPEAPFLTNLSIGILPKDAIQRAGAGEVNYKGYESGPYLLESTSDTEWVLSKNPHYTLSAPPKMAKVIFRIIPDAGTRYAALIKGDLDLVQNSLDNDKIVLIRDTMQDKLRILTGPRLGVTYLAFNFRDPVLSHAAIREAISLAINRQEILEYRLQNLGILARSIFPPDNYYFNKSLPTPAFDIKKAKELVQKSGVKSPTFSLTVSSANRSVLEVAKAISHNLKSVGIQANVESLENTIFMDRINKGAASAWIANWIGFKDPDHLHFIFSSRMVLPNGRNRGSYSNAELDKLLEEGRVELDQKKRKEIYDKAQEIIARDVPYVNLWHSLNTVALSKSVKGFVPYADGRYWSIINVTKN